MSATRTTLTTRRSGGSRPRLHRSSLLGRSERGADTITTITHRHQGQADPGELLHRGTPALAPAQVPGRDMLLLLPLLVITTETTDLEVEEGSEGARTGLTPGCEQVLTDGRAEVEVEGGPWTDTAGREVTPAAAAGAAVDPAGAGVPDGGGDIRPRTPAGHHQGKIITIICLHCTQQQHLRSRSRSSTPAGIPRRGGGEAGARPVKKEGAGGSGRSTAPLQKRLAGVTGHRHRDKRR